MVKFMCFGMSNEIMIRNSEFKIVVAKIHSKIEFYMQKGPIYFRNYGFIDYSTKSLYKHPFPYSKPFQVPFVNLTKTLYC